MFALKEPPNDEGDREGHRFPRFQQMRRWGRTRLRGEGCGSPQEGGVPPGGGIWKLRGQGGVELGQTGQGAFLAAGALEAMVWEQGRLANVGRSCAAGPQGRSRE